MGALVDGGGAARLIEAVWEPDVHVATTLGCTVTGRRGDPVVRHTDEPACTATGIPATTTRVAPVTHCPAEQKTPLGVREHPAMP
jgi:hypothetical protein